MCHGESGKGDGELANSLAMDVPDFTDAKELAKRSDGDLFFILTTGHGDMPGEGEDRLSETIRWNMITYVRSLGRKS
jgi:mono/diheme cytochrome c family protein